MRATDQVEDIPNLADSSHREAAAEGPGGRNCRAALLQDLHSVR
jgi:hypothetical protein